eukprot:754797-Hanusia_phi.AAC.3
MHPRVRWVPGLAIVASKTGGLGVDEALEPGAAERSVVRSSEPHGQDGADQRAQAASAPATIICATPPSDS